MKNSCIFITFISTFIFYSCSKENNVISDEIEQPVNNEVQAEIGEYAPFYLNSFWEYKYAVLHIDDVVIPGDTTTRVDSSFYFRRYEVMADTLIYEKPHHVVRVDHFSDANFQTSSSGNNAYYRFENNAYYVNNQKYLDMNLAVGESWNTDTTASEYPGGIIQNFMQFTIHDKNASIVVNNESYNNVVIVSSCNYAKLEGQDRFDCDYAKYNYYAKGVGLVHDRLQVPFIDHATDLLNYQIED